MPDRLSGKFCQVSYEISFAAVLTVFEENYFGATLASISVLGQT